MNWGPIARHIATAIGITFVVVASVAIMVSLFMAVF
jgi:hypothetical protein